VIDRPAGSIGPIARNRNVDIGGRHGHTMVDRCQAVHDRQWRVNFGRDFGEQVEHSTKLVYFASLDGPDGSRTGVKDVSGIVQSRVSHNPIVLYSYLGVDNCY
jgi:hypothetical protein